MKVDGGHAPAGIRDAVGIEKAAAAKVAADAPARAAQIKQHGGAGIAEEVDRHVPFVAAQTAHQGGLAAVITALESKELIHIRMMLEQLVIGLFGQIADTGVRKMPPQNGQQGRGQDHIPHEPEPGDQDRLDSGRINPVQLFFLCSCHFCPTVE